jgi:hypothetical protein
MNQIFVNILPTKSRMKKNINKKWHINFLIKFYLLKKKLQKSFYVHKK